MLKILELGLHGRAFEPGTFGDFFAQSAVIFDFRKGLSLAQFFVLASKEP